METEERLSQPESQQDTPCRASLDRQSRAAVSTRFHRNFCSTDSFPVLYPNDHFSVRR